MSQSTSLSIMSLITQQLFPSHHTKLLEHQPSSQTLITFPSRLHNQRNLNLCLSPQKTPSRNPISCKNGELETERELREAMEEILEEAGISGSEAAEIGLNSGKYGEMLRESVRDLDELSLWNSYINNEKKMEDMSFKEKVKIIAKEKGDNGKIPYLESVGLNLSSSIHLARLLSSEQLPSLIHKVKYVKEIFFSGNHDERLAGKLARRMMIYLSISVDEDVQQTLSFFEKIEARRGGLDMLGSCDASFRHLIESFPRLLMLSVKSNMKPTIKFLENIGVPREKMGYALLLFPPLLLLDTNDIRARLRPFMKVGALGNDVGRILVKYPWVLSKSIQENYEEICNFLDTEKVPQASVDRAIRDWPLLLGCSVSNLQPMMDQFDDLGVRTTKLSKVFTTSPQLLLQRPDNFQKVVLFLQDLGFDKESVGKILVRCPEVFATSIKNTLQKKVELLTSLGISKQQLPRVIKKYPELFISDVDRTVLPRLRYLIKSGLSEKDIASMVTRFSPLLGYSIEEVLKPKLEFLVNTMGKPVKDVVEYPRYFSYSLDKKIKPRFFVLRSRNISCSLKDMLGKNDEEFATEYLGIQRTFIPIR